ncbi:MAG: hypothetical protein K2L28_05895, partial [Muribaculaceae bacterium]|nr:hypothetical protein [Muribaculaceae bacterium]
FGIRTFINGDAQPDRWLGGNVSLSEKTPEVTLVEGPNSTWRLTRNREYTFTYNLSTKELKITWEAGEEPEVKDPIYIIGQVTEGEWAIMKGHPLANIPGTNKFYTTNLKTTADGQISVVTRLGANENDWESYSDEERFTIPVPQQDVNLGSFNLIGWTNHGNDKFNVGQGTFYAIVDMDAKTIEINKVSELFPEALYMYGNLVNGHFDFNTDKPVVANRGEYNTEAGTYDYKFEGEIVIVTATEPNENGYFILVGGPHYEAPAEEVALFAEENEIVRVTPEEANWSAIDDKHRFVLADNTVKPLLANAVPTAADHCTSILDGHKVTLTVTLSEAGNHSYTLEDKGVATGVEGVEADANASVEFFNLQGVRVANPENGIFIRRQGNKVTKVAIR